MLFAQIPAATKQSFARELKFDLKVVSLSLRDNPTEDSRYSKLAAVERYIREEEEVGTVDEPRPWFAGEMDMIIGRLGRQSSERPPVVYFSGETTKTIVGLGGAIRHLIGAPGAPATVYELPSSSIAALLKVLSEEAETERQEALADRAVDFYDQLWPKFMESLIRFQREGVSQRVEFLARHLMYSPPGSPQVEKAALLGSPVYVAALE